MSRATSHLSKVPLGAVLGLAALLGGAAIPSVAQAAPTSVAAKHAADKATGKKDAKKTDSAQKGDQAKSEQVETFGDWAVYRTKGKAKTCYALAQPKERAPKTLKRDAAYIFISNRPNENVKNEVSVIMGFAMSDGAKVPAEINGSEYELIAKQTNAWIKNPAEENQFIAAMKKGGKMIVKAKSAKGNLSTDTYSLTGLRDALDRVQKECRS